MNIAHILPHSVIFPLSSHSGRYDWVKQLAIRQVAAGHVVTIYCHPDSHIEGIHFKGISQPSADKRENNIATFKLAFSRDHDIYHSHFDELHYELASETDRPIIATQHWWPKKSTVNLASEKNPSNVWAVPPTNDMYTFDKSVGIQSKGYIYHGIDHTVFYPPHETQPTNRLLYVGRISPEKHVDLAISVALKSGFGLDIIGKVTKKNEALWNSLLPLVDGKNICYLGPKSHEELRHYYANARAVLFPSDTHEAFGLAAIESQACGTPVIMRRGGSRGELIDENKTGIVCSTEDEFVSAVQRAGTFNPVDCQLFAKKFSLHTMVEEYDHLYASVLSYDS